MVAIGEDQRAERYTSFKMKVTYAPLIAFGLRGCQSVLVRVVEEKSWRESGGIEQ